MKKIIANMFITGSKLFIICALSAIILGLLNSITAPQITLNKEKQEKLALDELISKGSTPGKKKPVAAEMVNSYYEITSGERIVSFVLELSGPGYGGPIKIMGNFKPDGELISAKVMDNKETPGLGKKAEAPGYMRKFIGKGSAGSLPIPTTADELARQLMKQGTGKGDTLTSREKKNAFLEIIHWIFGKEKSGSTDSVTGATITFKGISKALAAGAAYVQSQLGEPK